MEVWTSERVTALAPDPGSASAGQALAALKKWVSVARSDRAVWGLCQGSGKDPYQTRVDLSEPAFKCSCPSRKFPCKHGLGLLLLFAKDPAAFKAGPEPGWVTDWIAGRAEKAEKKRERAESPPDKPADPEAQAKRAAQRESRVRDGLAACRVWLNDLVRAGLAAAQAEPSTTWERAAARLVDAQAPGLASMVRQIPELIASGPGWDTRTLDHLGKLHLLLRAGEKLPSDLAGLAADVRAALGWNTPKEEVLATPALADRWVCLGLSVEDEDRLRVRRTWLVGYRTGRRALILDFAPANQPFDAPVSPGTQFDGEVSFYPGRLALRALVKSRGALASIAELPDRQGGLAVEAELRTYALALAANPWVTRWPMLLTGVRPVRDGNSWFVADAAHAALPLRPSFAAGLQLWRVLSISAGRPVSMLAEWDGESARPLSVIRTTGRGAELHDLTARGAA